MTESDSTSENKSCFRDNASLSVTRLAYNVPLIQINIL